MLVVSLFFFCILTALMVLRPARDSLGMERGLDSVRWLFVGTAVVTLLVNPLFGWMVSRLRRLHLIATTYAFFALSLVGFWALLLFAPDAMGARSGQAFYVWFSVFNLFVTMVFWALLAERFSSEQGKRLSALIAVGGTLGAIFGPWLASRLAQPLGTPALLLVAAGFLLLAIVLTWSLVRIRTDRSGFAADTARNDSLAEDEARIGGSALAGLRASAPTCPWLRIRTGPCAWNGARVWSSTFRYRLSSITMPMITPSRYTPWPPNIARVMTGEKSANRSCR